MPFSKTVSTKAKINQLTHKHSDLPCPRHSTPSHTSKRNLHTGVKGTCKNVRCDILIAKIWRRSHAYQLRMDKWQFIHTKESHVAVRTSMNTTRHTERRPAGEQHSGGQEHRQGFWGVGGVLFFGLWGAYMAMSSMKLH